MLNSIDKRVVELLNANLPEAKAVLKEVTVGHGSVTVSAEKILEVCQFLKQHEELKLRTLQVITGTDYPTVSEIEITYVLCSLEKNHELLLKVRVPRSKDVSDLNALPKVPSVVSVYAAANFQERECYDMLGVNFTGHPDLRRILCAEGWEGHPLRKDYVPAEKYLDMVINPAHKVNTEDHFFGKKLKEQMDNPKLVSWSWKDDSETTEESAGE